MQAEDVRVLVKLPKLLTIGERHTIPMVFIAMPEKTADEYLREKLMSPHDPPKAELVVESFVRMTALSPELQKQIRAELGILPKPGEEAS